jgi:hypothetical protein
MMRGSGYSRRFSPSSKTTPAMTFPICRYPLSRRQPRQASVASFHTIVSVASLDPHPLVCRVR